MNILFVTYGKLSVGEGALRSVSLLRALADAGNQVDVAACGVGVSAHPQIKILAGTEPCSRRKVRMAVLRAVGRKSYQVIHAVDDAVVYASRLARFRRIPLAYEAGRCFTGPNGDAPDLRWRLFLSYYQRVEKHILNRASLVFSSCADMTSDLKRLAENAEVVQIEDIPAHPLYPRKMVDQCAPGLRLSGGASFSVACAVLPGNDKEMRTVLLAARKVIEKVPRAGFVFQGLPVEAARAMAVNLDIQERCIFLDKPEPERFLCALDKAHAALFVPKPGQRYMHAQILTLMNSPAVLIAVQEAAYAGLLNDSNSIRVDYTATSIADGLLRVLEEPLLAFGITSDAQQLIADRYSFSSFKHKVRMAYHELFRPHH